MERVACYECETENEIERMVKFDLYDTPWDDVPRVVYLCSDAASQDDCISKLTDESWADFRYFECQHCWRMVCRQNPRNGWMVQARWIVGEDEEEQEICLHCYQAHLIEHGVDREDIENGELPGMFFTTGNQELVDAGFECILRNYHVATGADASYTKAVILDAMDFAHKVVIAYESLGIGGSEGYISVYSKEVK